ncbi:MAG TPA: methylated-DNA--[protein]-cysteine S-methyltransferase [Solirubrobacteraceae bacterium]|nr:methylated-DNA--[protein]-cysteine S-methyltransferase [Solirubrobacteraceae bacterium]
MRPSANDAVGRALRAGPAPRRAEAAAAAEATERLLRRIAREELADVTYGSVDSPFGTLHAAVTPRGLVRLAFPEETEPAMVEELARRISPRVVRSPEPLERLERELDEYFSGRRRSFSLKLDWRLIGPFARRVLTRTAAIPYGSFSSYGEIAAEAGSPRGARAAGNALGANPIPIVIPCHRVLHTGGGLGGYGGGLERKRFLLELEGALEG